MKIRIVSLNKSLSVKQGDSIDLPKRQTELLSFPI